jgi:hypothetical protein
MRLLIVAFDLVPVEVADAEVLVIAPARNSWLRHWLSDEDAARRRAQALVVAVIDRLERRGIHAEGRVGEADPLLAIADALSTFPADKIVIAAAPERVGELVSRARRRFALPISHGETATSVRTSRTARRPRAASSRRALHRG